MQALVLDISKLIVQVYNLIKAWQFNSKWLQQASIKQVRLHESSLNPAGIDKLKIVILKFLVDNVHYYDGTDYS